MHISPECMNICTLNYHMFDEMNHKLPLSLPTHTHIYEFAYILTKIGLIELYK